MQKLFALAALLALIATPAIADAVPASKPDLTLEGAVRTADLHRYIEIPFSVPRGLNRLTVVFSQDGEAQRTVIDLGVLDPDRFRGWSGGARSSFTLAATDATPGYLAGPIPGGRWRLLLGVPNIRPGVETHFQAMVYFGHPGEMPTVSSFSTSPLRNGPSWFRGDLHVHTAHSDGKCLSRSGVKVPCPAFLTIDAADRRGLDFIVVTDHNTDSHYQSLRELQPYFDRTLLIPGRELTTFEGHANALGGGDFIDFRLDGEHVRTADQMIAATHRAGALFSINHAAVPSGEACMGCGWTAHIEDPAQVDAVEIVNGGTVRATGEAEGPFSGFGFWQALLDKGFHPTAVGGSDCHDATLPLTETGSVGSPTTLVYAQNLSERAILGGIRAGHVFIDVQGSRDRSLEFRVDSPEGHANMGDHLYLPRGAEAEVHLHVAGVPGGHAELVHDAAMRITSAALSPPLHGDDTRVFTMVPDGLHHWLYVKIRDESGKLVLVSNPIYLEGKIDGNASDFF